MNENIVQLVKGFRTAIDTAKSHGEFDEDFSFCHFPRGCCGDTCLLLGHYLLANGINSRYVCGNYHGKHGHFQSHAWLLTDDEMIIDITGDQFKERKDFLNYSIATYCGPIDTFHAMFQVATHNVRNTVPLESLAGINPHRLPALYQSISKYLQ